MAFRDDVVLTLVLVGALATGSTAGTSAVTYRGTYDLVPAPAGTAHADDIVVVESADAHGAPVIDSAPTRLAPAPARPLTFPLRGAGVCHGVRARADRRHWRATFSVPLRCLGDPPWVQGVSQAGRLGPHVPVPR